MYYFIYWNDNYPFEPKTTKKKDVSFSDKRKKYLHISEFVGYKTNQIIKKEKKKVCSKRKKEKLQN